MRTLAIKGPGSWKLPQNDVWNVPERGYQIQAYDGPKPRGVVVDRLGYVYGPRTMQEAKPDGYTAFGRVSVMGRKVRAFTSRQIFVRLDGSLVDVPVLCISPQPPFESVVQLLEASAAP